LADVAVPRNLFRKILRLIDDLRPRPAPAQVEEIDGKVKSAGEVRLDGGKYGKMAYRARPTYQNQAIGRLRRENHYDGGAI